MVAAGQHRDHAVGDRPDDGRRRFIIAATGLAFAAALPLRLLHALERRQAKISYPIPAADSVSIVTENQVILVRWESKVYAFNLSCPHQNAYNVISDIERAVLRYEPEVVVLSAGPTATVLAHRLCRKGIQAIDLGSGGPFLLELLTDNLRESSRIAYEKWRKGKR